MMQNHRFVSAMGACALMVLVSILAMVPSALSQGEDAKAEIRSFDADVTIDNSYAVTNIAVVLANPGDEPMDETVEFQIPEDAFITNFSITKDGKTYYAQVMGAEDAEQKYEAAKENGQNAGLMASRGQSTFAYGISISPKATLTVGIRYEDFLERTPEGITYVLGLGNFGDRVIDNVDIEMNLFYGRTIKNITAYSYTNSTVITTKAQNTAAQVSFEAVSVPLKEDFIVNWALGGIPANGRMYFQRGGPGEDGYFFHVFSPEAKELGGYMPKDIVFVLDKSGSMEGTKIDQVKDAFSGIVDDLLPADRFEIIKFCDDTERINGGLVNASIDAKKSAKTTIGAITAYGSTDIEGGLIEAIDMLVTPKERVPIIILLTDGQPTAGQTDPDVIRQDIIAHNKLGISIYALGFGDDVDFEFLTALALENGGTATRIYEDSDGSQQITGFYGTVSLPVLRDIDFLYSKGTSEIFPVHVDAMFEGSDIVICGRFPANATKVSFQATSMTSGGARMFSEAFVVNTTVAHPFIERYWAYAKIGHYMDLIAVEGEKEDLVSVVENVSMEYGFVTEYTSLYVELPENEKVNQVQGDPNTYDIDGGSGNGGSGGGTGTYPPAKSKSAGGAAAPGYDAVLMVGAVLVAVAILYSTSRKRK